MTRNTKPGYVYSTQNYFHKNLITIFFTFFFHIIFFTIYSPFKKKHFHSFFQKVLFCIIFHNKKFIFFSKFLFTTYFSPIFSAFFCSKFVPSNQLMDVVHGGCCVCAGGGGDGLGMLCLWG